MGILLNGNKPSKIIYNGAESALYFNGSKIWPEASPAPTFDEVTIGSQTWMSKNLAIDDGQGGIATRTLNYGQGNVVEYYYTWDAAVRVASSILGWHLPTTDEWYALAEAVGGSSTAGTKLKSTYGWNSDGNGTDDFGFTIFPAGNEFALNGSEARFWAPEEVSSDYAEYIRIRYNRTSLDYSNFRKSNYTSIRLIKDAS